MKAWVIDKISDLTKEDKPLTKKELPKPTPKDGELLIKVKVCGVCHTELDEIEGRTPPPEFPVVPGHQVVGIVEESKVRDGQIKVGDRVGVAWIFSACGKCDFCLSGQENLCPEFKATGRDANGGYAEYMTVSEKYAYPIPEVFTDEEVAPHLCAGAIGFRSVTLCNAGNGDSFGLTGFGASAHLVLKLIKYKYPKSKVFVFARNPGERQFALQLGADWAGDSATRPPEEPDCIIDTTPVWKTVLAAMDFLKPGGRLVINAIRKENVDVEHLKEFDYAKHLWMEKEIKSVANITGSDVKKYLKAASEIPIKPDVKVYPFDEANEAVMDIKNRKIRGAKVIRI